ncbi:MAG: glycosyltransferase [Microbacterium sp.]|uniref:glycosyltransferase family 2 protein n=1 Tax=Microbacterium sp. TaxID=51671 RepID=UPI003BB0A301
MTVAEWKVSAVIPTIGRDELRTAVESALAQTAHLHEVVIGADTDEPLDLPDDARIRIVRTGPRAGGNVARMSAIRTATGNQIALLDDDDAWDPEKLERQCAAIDAEGVRGEHWLSASVLVDAHGRQWPRRLLQPGERLPAYLFRKERVKGGQGALHTSTLLFPRSLVIAHPFDEALRFHQDTDWLVKVDREVRDLQTVQVLEPLTVLRDSAGSISRGISPLLSMDWAKTRMHHLDRRTRGDFLVTVSYAQAIRHRSASACAKVLWTAFTWGAPGLKTLPAVVMLPLKLGRNARRRRGDA